MSTSHRPLAVLNDLTPDAANANLGTERGAALLKESIDRCGLGRSILVDKKGVIIAGNQVVKQAVARGVPVEVVETNGQELVVVQRMDLDLAKDRKARQLAYYDNRVQQVDLSWSPERINQDLSVGINVNVAFFSDEIDALNGTKKVKVKKAKDTDAEPVVVSTLDTEVITVAHADLSVAPAPVEDDKPQVQICFEGLPQRQRWLGFLRMLGERFPLQTTPAGRLMAYLEEVGIQ